MSLSVKLKDDKMAYPVWNHQGLFYEESSLVIFIENR
jgi:hypothetical protein